MRNVWLIARREYLERIHAKSFLIMTILIPILMGGLLFGGAVINSRIGSNHIAVVTDNPQFAEDLKTELSGKNRQAIVDVYSPTEPGVRDLLDQRMQKRSIGLGGYLWVTPPAPGRVARHLRVGPESEGRHRHQIPRSRRRPRSPRARNPRPEGHERHRGQRPPQAGRAQTAP